jgi:NAD(P)-dependent dehydrogenase (short-subunit alcohol dehydrogenase family)
MGDLSGKVAIITGAGRGLGREEALQLAGQGASVIISDIDLPDAKAAAEETVEDIKAAGGEATLVLGDCADTDDANRLFKTTLDTYGDVNIMVNNAGFCRDQTVFNMDDEQFDSVVRVHLRGHFVNMRNATNYWRGKAKQDGEVYGRLISTASEAAIFGSAGQANYGPAKAGIVAMTMGAAQLMIKYGVTCNVIMPRARTDMTNSGVTAELFAAPEDGFDAFNPANVAPLVGYLASPEAGHISGEVMVVWGSQVDIIQRPSFGPKIVNPNGGKWDLEGLHAGLSEHYNDDYVAVWGGYTVPPQ